MSKTIEIKKVHIRNFILSFILGFGILYGLEHFGKFSYISDSPTEYDSSGRVKLTTYVSANTRVITIYYETFFKNKIETYDNGFDVGDLNYSDTDFDKYSVKSYYYTQATLKDFKFGIYISLGLFLLTLFFTNFKIKLS